MDQQQQKRQRSERDDRLTWLSLYYCLENPQHFKKLVAWSPRTSLLLSSFSSPFSRSPPMMKRKEKSSPILLLPSPPLSSSWSSSPTSSPTSSPASSPSPSPLSPPSTLSVPINLPPPKKGENMIFCFEFFSFRKEEKEEGGGEKRGKKEELMVCGREVVVSREWLLNFFEPVEGSSSLFYDPTGVFVPFNMKRMMESSPTPIERKNTKKKRRNSSKRNSHKRMSSLNRLSLLITKEKGIEKLAEINSIELNGVDEE